MTAAGTDVSDDKVWRHARDQKSSMAADEFRRSKQEVAQHISTKEAVMRSRSSDSKVSGSEPTLLEILATSQLSAVPNELFQMVQACQRYLYPSSCSLCFVVANSVVRGLKSFFAEFVNDPKSRDAPQSLTWFLPKSHFCMVPCYGRCSWNRNSLLRSGEHHAKPVEDFTCR